MAEIPKNIKKTTKINFALIFVILIIIGTIGIYGYNTYIESENSKLEERISEVETRINEIKKDKNIQVYSLIQDNKKVLNKLESYSDITKIIKGMTYIENNYDLKLEGFNYSNGVVSTKASTDPEKVSNGYVATSDFISKYRKDKSKYAIFKLPYISKFIGNEKMSFSLKLEVKNNLINNKK